MKVRINNKEALSSSRQRLWSSRVEKTRLGKNWKGKKELGEGKEKDVVARGGIISTSTHSWPL